MNETAFQIPEAALALVGVPGRQMVAPEPIDRGAIRRFAQAIMDDDAIYYDENEARHRGFDDIVAPPFFPVHAMRRPGDAPDPFVEFDSNPDFDGAANWAELSGLPRLPLPFKRLLNGGNTIDVWSLARPGDIVAVQSVYVSLQPKIGKQGPMVIATTRREFTDFVSGRPLLTDRQVHIWR